MVDFVAAVAIDKTQPISEETEMIFSLRHEMTRLAILAKVSKEVYSNAEGNDKNKTFINIRQIKLKNLEGGNFYTSGRYHFATTNAGIGTWSKLQSNELDFTTIMDLTPVKIHEADGSGTDYNSAEGVPGVRLTGTQTRSLLKANEFLFLIPAGSEGLMAEKAYVSITYDIVTEDAALEKGYVCTPATTYLYMPVGTLRPGTAHTYTILIDVDKITMEASVRDWNVVSIPNGIDEP